MKILETVSLPAVPLPDTQMHATHAHAFGAQKMVAIGCCVAHRARITPITPAQATFCAGGDVLLRTDNGQVTEGGASREEDAGQGGEGYDARLIRHI